MAALAIATSHAATPPVRDCQRVDFQGEVNAGGDWTAAFGQGWVLRLLPIRPASAGYSGWDIAIDRDPPAGYPDSLLVASLPYDSINEREIGTTFGLRAQDAIGWNPRSFRFLTDPGQFRQAQQWFGQLARERAAAEDSGWRSRTALAETRIDCLQRAASHSRFAAGAGDGRPAAFCPVLGPGFLANSASDRGSHRERQAAGRTCVDAICGDALAFARLAASPWHNVSNVRVQGIKKGTRITGFDATRARLLPSHVI